MPVLVAEDNLVNQKVIVRILERAGYTVDVVTNGIEAIAAVRSGQYAVVFMDIQMPQLDGLEATVSIRKLLIAQPYIIALTAAVAEVDRDRCLVAGMNDFVSKPARAEDLSEALQRAFAVLNQATPVSVSHPPGD